jgi:ribosomal protein S18 acetylase RimI-like enzyme
VPEHPSIVQASALELGELAALFTAGYEDYYTPIRIDRVGLEFMVGAWDIDLDASRVASLEDSSAGVVLLGIRGSEGWVGGLGVVPPLRRRGVGEALMRAAIEQAEDRSVRDLRLEVIKENERAIPLYERLGFTTTRELDVWSLPAATSGAVREIPVEAAHETIRACRRAREPWQRADASLANLSRLTGLGSDTGAAIVRVSAGRVSVLQLAGDDSALRELLSAARALGDSVSIVNLPRDDPAAATLRELGGRVDLTQYEMALSP